MSTVRIYNTLTRTVEPLEPREPGKVSMYVCGMTTYDFCHIGHARAMISFDIVYRWLTERGYDVTYVRNHTDVDDKIIARANELGEDPLALSNRFVEALETDLDRLGLLRPTHEPRVSRHIDDIIALIEKIIANGHGYAVDGDVFFAVDSYDRYGQLSGKRLDDQRSGERIEVDGRKRHPGDFALWKSAKPGEVAWDSPWGRGRPGWHIECSAMSMEFLGDSFDIHGGGIDLIFPHHENEIAQSECGTGHVPFARYWLHNGHLNVESGKMSKSLGNVVRIRDILDEVPAEALRLLYVGTHYRSPLPYSTDRLVEALGALDRLYQAKETLEEMAGGQASESADALVKSIGEPAAELYAACKTFAQRFGEAMDEDFNSAAALAVVYELVRAANRFGNNRKWRKRGAALAGPALEALALTARALGIGAMAPADWFAEVRTKRLSAIGHTADEVAARIAERDAARATKDWAKSDAIRDELLAWGVVLMDGPTGTDWRMKVAD